MNLDRRVYDRSLIQFGWFELRKAYRFFGGGKPKYSVYAMTVKNVKKGCVFIHLLILLSGAWFLLNVILTILI